MVKRARLDELEKRGYVADRWPKQPNAGRRGRLWIKTTKNEDMWPIMKKPGQKAIAY